MSDYEDMDVLVEQIRRRDAHQAKLEQRIAELEAERDEARRVYTEAYAAYESHLAYRNSQILTLNAMVFAPGEWYCPKCNFALSRQTLFVNSGTVGVSDKDRDESEPCPNDGTPMERVTYKQRMEDHYRWGVDMMERNQAGKQKFDKLHEIVSETALDRDTEVYLLRIIREGLAGLGFPKT